ncbi:MAG TPA: ABC transporter ATP-binding protein [Candidatus Saccharimonadales bacterium]|nr:ABC transporter ATP-binding protein [Candidatus Saccharimonadales bacterium]
MSSPSTESSGSSSGIEVLRLKFAYQGASVLSDISLHIGEGEFVSLLGPSGCGKTTLLRLLAGLDSPGAGTIFHGGEQIQGPSLERGVVFQNYSLFPWLTLSQNIELALSKSHQQHDESWRRKHASDYLDRVGLKDSAAQYPSLLSGGMQQRGAIARALALGSPVLLMDEPFGALDPVNRAKLQDLLLDVWASTRKTIVFVTHDVEEALYLADRVVMLGSSPGRIIQEITIPFERPRSRHIFQSRGFVELSERIDGLFREDVLQRIESESVPVREAI